MRLDRRTFLGRLGAGAGLLLASPLAGGVARRYEFVFARLHYDSGD